MTVKLMPNDLHGTSVTPSAARQSLAAAQRWVVKIGSALLTDDGKGLNVALIQEVVRQIAALRQAGKDVVVVSSGAVAAGLTRLNLSERPTDLNQLQAMAAIGQMQLVQTWESAFAEYNIQTAQVLLTHDDVKNRKRYLNARGTLRALLSLGVIPVINENDTVATDEMRLGDNDTLAGLVVNLVDAEAMIILTDQPGMFTADPRSNPDAELLDEVHISDPTLLAMAGGSAGSLGRGGMRTKVIAAQQAAHSGAMTVIVGGREQDVITRVSEASQLGTLLLPADKPVAGRKLWIAAQSVGNGLVYCDAGAVAALRKGGRSLLSAGVTKVLGDFERGDCVLCVDADGQELARGLTNYNADEARQLCGVASDNIGDVLGYVSAKELIHRDNLLVT